MGKNFWNQGIVRRWVLGLAMLAGIALLSAPFVACGSEDVKSSEETSAVASSSSGFFDSNGVRIHYETYGAGEPLIMVHGFTGSIESGLQEKDLVDALQPGRKLVFIDVRGHGQSDKPHDEEAYSLENMASDVLNLMDYLGIEKADLYGYSMGAGISHHLLAFHQDRFNAVVLGGTGSNMEPNPQVIADIVAQMLLADDPTTIANPGLRDWRDRVDAAPNSDRLALAACAKRFLPLSDHMTAEDVADVNIPVLIIVGSEDAVTANLPNLVAAIPGVKYVEVPGRTHEDATSDPMFAREVATFLSEN